MNNNQDGFERNVFINCPFDKEYIPLLRALIFTVIHLGFNPKIATERADSGETRIEKIRELIETSKWSIHDLSRISSLKNKDINRMNMPFELGIDMGCKFYKGGVAKTKRCLILEKEKYNYQKALSDISGSDIKNHNNEPEELVLQVRNWFVGNSVQPATSGTQIWDIFNEFMVDFEQEISRKGFKKKDLEAMTAPEYIYFIKEWFDKQE